MRRVRLLWLVLLLAACAPAARPPGGVAPLPPPYDLVISGGRIVDGTGAPWFYGDLAIRGDRIARVTPSGLLRDAPARERMDARGMVVAPGFIDIQGQSGGSFLFGDGRDVSKVTQGITTEILGEGGTPAPANQRTVGDISRLPPARQAVVRAFMTPRGFSRWLEAMERHGISPNVGSFLGAATVRQYVKGMALGEPTPAELDTMRAVVRRAMEDGAFGVASALIYPPGNFAGTPELIQMARAMAPYGGVYITHMRSEADQLLEAIDEAIRIGREGGVPVEIYHLKAGGLRNWPKAARAIAKIDSARAAGLDVQANMYPYIAGGTGLSSCLPPWAAADDKLLDNLRDPAMRPKIRAEVMQQTTDWENLCQLATPDGVLVLGLLKPENQVHAGKRLSEIAAAVGKDWLETAMDLLLAEEQRIGTIYFMMSEDNVKLQLTQPWLKFGTDAGGADPDSARGLTHPRAYGTYPRILGKYVRDEGVLTLEDAVRKATSAVATRLSIQDRGVLREGFYADVVVFDPTTIADRATFEEPHQLSVGVRDVFVNGVGVVRGGRHTGSRPGRVVRGPGYGGH
ncbi:MAG: D-aminoacylase [Gemmatimonadetes bacterium]|nr:D-aminoacylase [Gemmatimonadota bacterium]